MEFSWYRKRPLREEDGLPVKTQEALSVTLEHERPVRREPLDDATERGRRVNLLLDTFYQGEDAEAVSTIVLGGVAKKGYRLSRKEWDAIRAGEPSVCDEQTLTAVSQVLGIAAPYLSQRNHERDELIEAELELIQAVKEHKTTTFRACLPDGTYGANTAEDMRHIARLIRKNSP